jgi:hypothetical protein
VQYGIYHKPDHFILQPDLSGDEPAGVAAPAKIIQKIFQTCMPSVHMSAHFLFNPMGGGQLNPLRHIRRLTILEIMFYNRTKYLLSS